MRERERDQRGAVACKQQELGRRGLERAQIDVNVIREIQVHSQLRHANVIGFKRVCARLVMVEPAAALVALLRNGGPPQRPSRGSSAHVRGCWRQE